MIGASPRIKDQNLYRYCKGSPSLDIHHIHMYRAFLAHQSQPTLPFLHLPSSLFLFPHPSPPFPFLSLEPAMGRTSTHLRHWGVLPFPSSRSRPSPLSPFRPGASIPKTLEQSDPPAAGPSHPPPFPLHPSRPPLSFLPSLPLDVGTL